MTRLDAKETDIKNISLAIDQAKQKLGDIK